MELGEAIKSLRTHKGLTLAQLADGVGSHVGNLSRIERGINKPSLDMLYRISEALGYKLSDIFLMAEEKDSANRDGVAEINTIFLTLLDSDKKLLLQFAKFLKDRQGSGEVDRAFAREETVHQVV